MPEGNQKFSVFVSFHHYEFSAENCPVYQERQEGPPPVWATTIPKGGQ
jgi:hypothetical protein